ncbi:MAG: NYN domain-containing protein [Prevotellaceae bacterium]|jgi:uncharacterized LabA/DUF88 family protein|nr:NYN domain-containing protein [Prevotellaceae bacterium]
MKRVVVLVDGQNLYYTLKDLSLIEKDIKWNDFFNHLLEPEDELIRAYWFRAQRILDTHYTHQHIEKFIIRRQFKSHYENYKNNKSAIPKDILERINREIAIVEDWLKKEKTRFSNIEFNYDQICLENTSIEIVKKGVLKINPYTQGYIGEKGVDIALAVKMISLSVEKKCDKIILVSGDYDYAEAIQYVKNNMTKIHIVKIHKGIPPRNQSVSRDLAVLADRVINIYESEIKDNFVKQSQK